MKKAGGLYLFLCAALVLLLMPKLAPMPVVSGSTPIVFNVNSAGDDNDDFTGDGICADSSGKCTLRAAIEESNALKVDTTIYFSLPSPTTIYLDNSLGYVNYADIIGPNDLGITIDGQNSDNVGVAFSLASSKSTTIKNLRLQHFTFAAIVTENFAGTDQIINNIIINNGMRGIRVSGHQITIPSSGSIIITGNHIGFDPISGIAGPNGTVGIDVDIRSGSSSGSIVRIGGDLPEDRNVISGNIGSGIKVYSEDPDAETQILGNFIGTDDSGTIKTENVTGIWIDRHPGLLTIGGSTSAHGNLVAGNKREGIILDDSVNATIQHNRLSTNSAGTVYLPNGERDIKVTDSNLVNINDNTALQGIAILGSETYPVTDVSMNGNYVGVTRSGFVRPVSTTGTGIYTKYMYDACQIGYNRITGFRTGIHVDDGTYTSMIANKIFDVSGLGIDIDPWLQINPNDHLDADEGPNHMQNFPTLTVVKTPGSPFSAYDITVHLHSAPNTLFRVEVYSSDVCFPGGYGEGEEMEKFSNGVMTDSNGDATWQVSTIYSWEIVGECFTATASKVLGDGVYGSTSEFSRIVMFINLPLILR